MWSGTSLGWTTRYHPFSPVGKQCSHNSPLCLLQQASPPSPVTPASVQVVLILSHLKQLPHVSWPNPPPATFPSLFSFYNKRLQENVLHLSPVSLLSFFLAFTPLSPCVFRTILLKVMPSAFLNPVDPSQPFPGLAHSFLSLSLGSRILEFRFPLSVAFSSSFPCIFLTSLAQGFGAQTPAPHFSFCSLGSHPVLWL